MSLRTGSRAYFILSREEMLSNDGGNTHCDKSMIYEPELGLSICAIGFSDSFKIVQKRSSL